MKINKSILSFAIMALLLLVTPGVAEANGVIEPYPACGMHTVSYMNDIILGDPDENIRLGTEMIGGVPYSVIVSSHGWEIVEVHLLLGAGGEIIHKFPHVTKALFPNPGVALLDLLIILEKECPTCNNIPTGRFVYTLFGNYPCNLISEENTIPPRFLNPGYTGPLCNLPNLDHVWNGNWVRNQEINCGGYFIGGNHYDTRLDVLP